MVIIGVVENPAVGQVCTTTNTQLKIGHVIVGTGTLYLNPETLVWLPNDRPEGMSIPWRQISIHGISANPQKCIYFIIDHRLCWEGVYNADDYQRNGDHQNENGEEQVNGDASDADSISESMTELWLTPEDPNEVDTIYQAMTDCQALHPDALEGISDSDSDYMDFDGEENEGGEENLDNEQDLNINDERFADAEE